MNALITGYPGFLSGFLYEQLEKRYCTYTLGLLPSSAEHHIQADLTGKRWSLPDIKFDLVVHAAGKAHVVPKTEAEKELFYKVNFEGTKNLIGALDNLSEPPEALIFISTVAVYGLETGCLLDEDTPVNPVTPYGDSKRLAEEFIKGWESKTRKVIVRLPLLVGKNPPGNLGRMINAIKKGRYFNINGGMARRSMVLAEDLAGFMDTLAQHEGIYNLTDGCHPSYKEIGTAIAGALKGKKTTCLNIPYLFLKPFALLGDLFEKITRKSFPVNSLLLKKVTSDLTFSDKKARTEMGWNPRPVLAELPTVIQ